MSEADKIIKNLKNSGKKVEEFYVSNKTSDKNVANDSVIAHKFATMQQQIDKKDKRIKELQEENAEIKNTKMNGYLHENLWLAKYLNELYIPKQAVIDKINEYDKKMEEDAGHPHWVVTDRIVMNVLQELLERERK